MDLKITRYLSTGAKDATEFPLDKYFLLIPGSLDLRVKSVERYQQDGGEETGDADLDAGRTLTCADTICADSWPVTLTAEVSTTLTIAAVARDSSGQESEQVQAQVLILPPE